MTHQVLVLSSVFIHLWRQLQKVIVDFEVNDKR